MLTECALPVKQQFEDLLHYKFPEENDGKGWGLPVIVVIDRSMRPITKPKPEQHAHGSNGYALQYSEPGTMGFSRTMNPLHRPILTGTFSWAPRKHVAQATWVAVPTC